MQIDAHELAPDALLETDVCIIGSGPAGIAAALGLLERGRQCILLESGIDRFSPDHQSVGELDSAYNFGNLQDRQLDERRQIGGKANAWSIESDLGTRGVRLLPYNAANFEARPAMGGVAWPFGRKALDPFYAKAAALFEIPNEGWEFEDGADLPLTGPLVQAMRFRFSDGAVLSRRVREEIAPAQDIRLICNATALKLDLNDEGSAITQIRCASEPGRFFRVTARAVIVSGGALSTTALLLRSNDVRKDGIGNQNGLVGRYFMDHPLIDGGQLVIKDPALFDRAGAYDLRREGPGLSMAHLQLRGDIIREQPVANINAMLYPRPRLRNLSSTHQNQRRRAQAAWRVLKNRREGAVAKAQAALTLAANANHIIEHRQFQKDEYNARINRGGWSLIDGASARYKAFEVLHICEQAPRYDNRVKLGEELDRFGQRRVSIDWTWTAEDKAAVKLAQDLFVKTFNASGGDYQVLRQDGDPEIVHSSLGHHIGTTRMHDDPKQGVTDGDAKVHGVSNLYIASSALFPSGGWENPTLTVAALAYKLADHLAAQR